MALRNRSVVGRFVLSGSQVIWELREIKMLTSELQCLSPVSITFSL